MSFALFLSRKCIALVAVVLVVSAVVYGLGRGVLEGDIATVYIGDVNITDAERQQVRHDLGLDRPVYVAYLDWLGSALTGDLGSSPITHRPVTDELGEEFLVSFELALLSMLLAAAVGIPLGIFAAVRAGSAWDSLVRVSLLVIFGIPAFVTAIVLLLLAAEYFDSLYQIEYVPITDDLTENLRGMFLPVLAVALPPAAITLQLTRSTMIEALAEPYVTMARALGTRRRTIIYLHAFRNALPAVINLLALLFGLLLGGLVVVETVFNLPGLGRGMVESLNSRDFQVLVPEVVVIAAVFVTLNTLADILHPILDPRLR